MARPRKPRFVSDDAPVSYFKPQGIPLVSLSEVILTLDGCEALRLVDVESLDQQEAAFLLDDGRNRDTGFPTLFAHVAILPAWAVAGG